MSKTVDEVVDEIGKSDFGDFSDPEALERNKRIAEEGFYIKDPNDPILITDPTILDLDKPKGIYENENIWKERYFKLLEVVNTFKND